MLSENNKHPFSDILLHDLFQLDDTVTLPHFVTGGLCDHRKFKADRRRDLDRGVGKRAYRKGLSRIRKIFMYIYIYKNQKRDCPDFQDISRYNTSSPECSINKCNPKEF